MLQFQTFAAADLSLTTLIPRVFISMLVVIGVMWIAARVMKNRQVPGSGIVRSSSQQKNAPALQIVARQGVGRNSAVAIIKADNKSLLIGISESNISLLADLGGKQADEHPVDVTESQWTGTPEEAAFAANSDPARKGLLEQVREMTVRKI